MQDQVTNVIPEIPAYIQTILNALAFLIAATTMWYGYFVRGKKKAESPVLQVSPSTPSIMTVPDPALVAKISQDVERIADSAETISSLMSKHDMEEEIDRRIKDRLERLKNEQ